jgi:hypothetical protein
MAAPRLWKKSPFRAASAMRIATIGAFLGTAAWALAAPAAVAADPAAATHSTPAAGRARIAKAAGIVPPHAHAVAAAAARPASVPRPAVAPAGPPPGAVLAAFDMRPAALALPQRPIEIRPGRGGRAPIVVEALPGMSIIPPFVPARAAGEPPKPLAALPLDIELTAPWAERLLMPVRAEPAPVTTASGIPRNG